MAMLFLIVFMIISLEFFELNWQKSDTLKGVILKNYRYYSQNSLLFIIRHLSFIFILFIVFYLEIQNIYSYMALLLKFTDIAIKLFICNKIEQNGEKYLNNIFKMEDIKLGGFLPFLNMMIYSSLILFSLFN